MNVIISNTSDEPIYEQIYKQIRSGILRGEYKEGEALPSIRALAKDLRISVITTKRAFDDLEHDGFIFTIQGKGSFVAAKNKALVREEHLRRIEQNFRAVAELAEQADISKAELKEMFRMAIEENET